MILRGDILHTFLFGGTMALCVGNVHRTDVEPAEICRFEEMLYNVSLCGQFGVFLNGKLLQKWRARRAGPAQHIDK